jgi:type I restriction enzyme R subunit
VLIDCVGVTEENLSDSPPLEKKYSVAFETLLKEISFGVVDADSLSSLAGRLARLDRQIGEPDRQAIAEAAGGTMLKEIIGGIIKALDPDAHEEAARVANDLPPDAMPTTEQITLAKQRLLAAAAKPLAANPALRTELLETKKRFEQTIDAISEDEVLYAGFSRDATDRAQATVTSFRLFIEEHKDEITALQVLYSRPYAQRLRFKDIKALADSISAPPRNWTTETLWRAYETLDRSKVRGSGTRVLTDVVSLVRFAIGQEDELVPYSEQVNERFAAWMVQQEVNGRTFTEEQRALLEDIRDHVASSLRIEPDDFEYSPFTQHGGIGRLFELFGPAWPQLLEELNEALAA